MHAHTQQKHVHTHTTHVSIGSLITIQIPLLFVLIFDWWTTAQNYQIVLKIQCHSPAGPPFKTIYGLSIQLPEQPRQNQACNNLFISFKEQYILYC